MKYRLQQVGQGLGFVAIMIAALAALAPSLIGRITWFYDNWQVMAAGLAIIVALTSVVAFFILRGRDKY